MPKQIHAIFFDLDDTLFNATKAYEVSLRQMGIDPNGAPYQEARKRVKDTLKQSPQARNRLLYFKELLTATHQFSPRLLLEWMEKYERALAAEIKKQWIDLERNRLFEKLQSRFPMALVTNENLRTQLIKLEAIDPEAVLFKTLITSEEIGMEKPDLRPFQRALQLLRVQPENCIMVGDDLKADIAPALQLGMQAIWTTEFSSPSHSSPEGAYKKISQLDQLKEMIGL